ncbi:hypothetical protein BJ508DRAFT_305288 [Ascobolus immersus RN42]|uniref:Peptidase S59 domain-containing protein n=1 Tax=Ascobolus immersus RN42 TaxID=1160509 RepID=A0A3N4IM54_ASCIM|nr:hypothetical protein BJ508DRAFT_305288 [Ascobolus immersus RN42]
MFGQTNNSGTGFGGFGQQNQGNTGGGLFGSGNTGTGTGAFGSGGTTTGFGATNTASPFGAKPTFGSSTSGTGLFGSNTATTQPSTGFGAFGGGTTTSSGFGTTNTTGGGMFGKPAFGGTATSTGTTGGGLFGTAGGSTGFGTNTGTTGFGAAAANAGPVPATGTATPEFSAFQEKDPAGSVVNHYQNITFMPAYQKASQEELRVQDYLLNQKFPNQAGASNTAGGFGTTTGTTGGFGSGFGTNTNTGSAFGTQNNTTGTGLFGSNTNTSSPFGAATNTTNTGFGGASNTGGGLFGQKPAGGLFGSGTTGTNTAGTGLFGAANNNTTNTGGAFGGGTGFGAANNNTNTGTGLFGQNNNTAAKPFGSAFGTGTTGTGFGQTAQPSTGFGAAPNTATTGTGTGLFGSNTGTTGFGQTNTATNTTSPFGGFGQQNQQQQQQPQQNAPGTTGGLFGGGFGNNAAKPATTGGFGGFGGANTSQPTNSLFGGAQNQTQTQPASTGLFGQQPAATNTGGGLFGQTKPATGGLFGGGTTGTTGGGLFGNAQQNNNTNTGTGLFGAKPATTGTGLFGNTGTNTSNTGTGLFGNTLGGNNTGGTGLFGGQQQQQPQNTGLFGNSMMGGQQQMQQNFSTSVNDQSAYGHNPLFSMANGVQGNTGPIATPLSGSTQKKKAAMIPLNKIAPKQQTLTPRLGSSFSRSASPFTGSTSGTASIGSSLGRSFATGSKLHLFDSDDSVLSSGTFTPSSNSRVASLKKLVIDRKIRDQDLFTGGLDLKNTIEPARQPKNLLKKVVSFDTGVTQIDDDDSSNLGFLRSSQRRRAIEEEKRPEASPEANAQNALALVKPDEQTENDEGYWMQPSLSKLKSMTPQQLSRVTNFTVGRRGYGQVRFEPAVDLSKINLDEIMGGIVIFDKRVCTVYSDDYKKPEEGVELNVPSVISLEDCYPQHKDTRKKITDPEHPRIAAHLGRLRNIKDTEFMDYNVATGVWIFRVQHFTTYGLGEDDDEEDFYPQEDTPKAIRQQQPPSDESFSEADVDASVMDMSGLDDTFEFKKLANSHDSNQRASHNRQLAFPQQTRYPSNNYAQDDSSFLGEGSVGSLDDEIEIDEPAEPVLGDRDIGVMIADEDELTETEMDHDRRERLINLDSLKTARSPRDLEDETDPVKRFPKCDSWIDQLNNTVVPVRDSKDGIVWRHDRLGKKKEKRQESPKTYDHMDLMADLYGNGEGDGADFLEYLNTETVVFPKLQPPFTTLESLESAFRNAIHPGWGANGNIYHSAEDKEDVDRALKKWITYNTKLQQLDLANLYQTSTNTETLTAPLEWQYLHSEFILDDYNLPFAEFDYRASFSAFAESISWGADPRSQYEKKVWQLAGILFDAPDYPLQGLDDDTLRLMDTRSRKDKLSAFFQQLVERDVNRQIAREIEPLRTAIAQLTGNRVEQACGTLVEGGNLRLATLLSLIGGDENMRNEIKQQIVTWSENGYLAEIPVDVRAFYELLSGNTCFSKGIKEPSDDVAREFFLTEEYELDWKRAFAMKLWYGITRDENLRIAVLAYQHDMEEYRKHVPRPTPWFLGRNDVPADAKKQDFDLFWGLLRIYTETGDPSFALESVVPFRDFSQQKVDHRLAWQLRTMLARRNICDFSREGIDDQDPERAPVRADVLTAQYAQQLDQSGLFQWAVFVVLHLNDPDEREMSVRNLLARNVDKLTLEPQAEVVKFLLNLKVPIGWIHEAHALQARERGDFVKEAEHLLAADAVQQAHNTIIRKVGPNAIISGRTKQLRALLSMFDDKVAVIGWTAGGGVYQEYLKMIDALAARAPEHDIAAIAKKLLNVLDAVERKTFEQKVAVGEMGKVVSKWILKHGASAIEKAKVLKLPLAEDQVLRKTLDLSVNYYKTKIAEVY